VVLASGTPASLVADKQEDNFKTVAVKTLTTAVETQSCVRCFAALQLQLWMALWALRACRRG